MTKLEACFTSVIFETKIPKAKARRLAFSGYGLNFLSLPFKGDRNFGVKSILQERDLKTKIKVLSKLLFGAKCTEK